MSFWKCKQFISQAVCRGVMVAEAEGKRQVLGEGPCMLCCAKVFYPKDGGRSLSSFK